MRTTLLPLSLGSLLILAGCGKQQSPSAPSPSAPSARSTAPAEPAESPDEARALDLYEKWQAAREVKLTPEDIAALPAQAAQSARQRGEVLDLELLMGSDAKPELFAKFHEISRRQIDAVEAEVAKQPKAVQDIFRSLFSGRGVRNPQALDDSRIAFECDSNAYDSSDTDQHSDVLIWDLKDGSVKCRSNGEGLDGDWACRELGASADGNAFAVERRFMGPREKAVKDPFTGIVWFRELASPPAPLVKLESWTPDGAFVFPKEGDKRFFQRPALSGDGRRIAVIVYFSPSESDRRDYGDSPSQELVILDRDSRKARALSRPASLGLHAISRDGGVVAVYGPPAAFETGSTDQNPALYRAPADGSPPQRVALPEGVTIDIITASRPSLSADGSRIAFNARAGSQSQVYLYDRAAGTVTLLSATPAGAPGNGASSEPVISADGGTVAFASLANNLIDGVASGQLYIHDIATRKTRVASLNAEGKPCRGVCSSPSLSADGGLLAFLTTAEDMPGVRVPKKARSGPPPSRLFAIRLKDNRCSLLGGTLPP